jgi:uncharacterized membrane protein
MNFRVALILFISGLGIATQPSLADPINFTVTLIDVPGSRSTTAIGINNSSQIVGSYTDSAGTTHGFLDTNSTFTTLDFPGSTFTQATGINNVGQIVGFYSGGAFLYQNGAFSNLNIPAARFVNAFGIPQQVAINDSGQIVGTTSDARGFLYANGQLTFLPTSAQYPAITALGINNVGDIAGGLRPSSFIGGYPFVYKNGQYTSPSVPSDEAAAYGVNDAGHVLVYNGDSFGSRTYLIVNGVTSAPPPDPLFQYFEGIPQGLNDADQIVGSDGLHGFLATPVPEPSSVLLFVSGLAGVGLLLRRKKV